MMKGLENVINALDSYLQEVKQHSEAIPAEVKNNLVEDIATYPSIYRGWYIQAVAWHPIMAGGLHWEIDARNNPDVIYDGWLEFETWNRGRKTKRVARLHNQHAIENSDYQHIFDDIADSNFSNSFVV